ncbi:hypothetical protein C6I21_09280 [Alkalicoccus urumqiensis]|uniref:Uncharacterized protein n=2 Tax=Alkalicoccus urumqiensis TaxID=1548213 RepID=A0A2P6MGC1_ALKUR|nr:hypothetical protein C6I21_09280 [Alkalicoccus urumqiensis]
MDIEGETNEGSFDAGDPSELREQAEETLAEFTPSEEEAFSRASFEEHAYVYTLFQQQGEDYAVEEENTVSSAEWIAAELDAWRTFAEEDYGFSYTRENFEAYMNEQEEQVLQEDTELQVLLDVLESENPELSAQQLEFQYAKSFIWQQIREDAAADAEVNPSSTQEWNQLYFEVEQNVFEQLQENYPELNSSADGPE